MANRYDDETMKFIETRKRVAHMRREEARRKRNIMIAIIAAVVILVVIIAFAATSCGCGGSDKEDATTVAPTTEATTEPVTEEVTEEETEEGEFTEGSKAYVNGEGVHLREEASETSEIIDSLDVNAEVTVIAVEDDWVKVKYNEEEGYISKSLLSPEKVKSGSSDDSEDTDSGNDSDDGDKPIETRNRQVATTKKSSSSSSSSSKKNTNDKRTIYGN